MTSEYNFFIMLQFVKSAHMMRLLIRCKVLRDWFKIFIKQSENQTEFFDTFKQIKW